MNVEQIILGGVFAGSIVFLIKSFKQKKDWPKNVLDYTNTPIARGMITPDQHKITADPLSTKNKFEQENIKGSSWLDVISSKAKVLFDNWDYSPNPIEEHEGIYNRPDSQHVKLNLDA